MNASREDTFDGQRDLYPDRPIVLAGTTALTKTARRYGRVPRGGRSRTAVPDEHCRTAISTTALRVTGLIAETIFEGAANGASFRVCVTDTLIPALKPSDIVILDDPSAHTVAGARESIEKSGQRQGLPRPALHPRLQSHRASLRRAESAPPDSMGAKRWRTTIAIQQAFAAFRQDECRNDPSVTGYDADHST